MQSGSAENFFFSILQLYFLCNQRALCPQNTNFSEYVYCWNIRELTLASENVKPVYLYHFTQFNFKVGQATYNRSLWHKTILERSLASTGSQYNRLKSWQANLLLRKNWKKLPKSTYLLLNCMLTQGSKIIVNLLWTAKVTFVICIWIRELKNLTNLYSFIVANFPPVYVFKLSSP